MGRASLFSLALLSACVCSAAADEVPGSMKLPPGSTAKNLQGKDSLVGAVSRDNGLTIHYDIGALAGNYTKGLKDDDLAWRKEQTAGGRPVQTALTKDRTLYVTFPDDNANFYGKVSTDEELADFLLMTLTYVPQKGVVAAEMAEAASGTSPAPNAKAAAGPAGYVRVEARGVLVRKDDGYYVRAADAVFLATEVLVKLERAEDKKRSLDERLQALEGKAMVAEGFLDGRRVGGDKGSLEIHVSDEKQVRAAGEE